MRGNKNILSGGLFGFLILVSGLSIAYQPAQATEIESGSAWSEKMRKTSKILIDGFPFLFSRREFRQPGNRRRILSYIDGLKQNSHELPTEVGKRFLGADPLIDHFKQQIPQVLNQAANEFSQKNYDVAQDLVKTAVHKCVACHTAYQMGPRNDLANDEVIGIPLDPMSKFEVSIALRQFQSALNILETAIKGSGKSTAERKLAQQYLRMHLLVSVRSLQDTERAKRAISMYSKVLSQPDALVPIWRKDLDYWEGLKGSASDKLNQIDQFLAQQKPHRSENEAYVIYLLKTFLLHQTLVEQKDQKSISQVYMRLAKNYQALKLPILQDLSTIYEQAGH